MWQDQYKTNAAVPAEKLFAAISDVDNWSKWDVGLEFTQLTLPVADGASFMLKPERAQRSK